jgi:hypothetical protein
LWKCFLPKKIIFQVKAIISLPGKTFFLPRENIFLVKKMFPLPSPKTFLPGKIADEPLLEIKVI